jgi:acyl carrier protein
MPRVDEPTVLADLLRLLADITQDWDLEFDGGLSPATRLVADLGFESIDMVMLIEEIQRHFGRDGIPFEDLLIVNEQYVDDVEVGTLAGFVYRHLDEDGGAG